MKKLIAAGFLGGIIALIGVSLMAPRDGSGTYTLPAGNPVSTGTTISSTWANATLADIGTGLSNSLAKDGQTVATANLPMGTFRHTNVGNASARNHYAAVGQVQDWSMQTLGSVAGTNTITGNLSPAITAYAAGMVITFQPANTNTGAATLAPNGLTALDLLKADGDALISGDLVAGIPAVLVLDTGADDWILLNPQASVNGVAFSDLARLSLANTFTLAGTNAAPTLTLSSTLPVWHLNESDGAANNRRWSVLANNEALNFAASTDDGSSALTFFAVQRTGTTVDSVNLTATSVQANGLPVTVTEDAGTRIAYGGLDGTTGSAGGSGITSGSRSGTGQYTVNVTAAGFSGTPTCLASASKDVGQTAVAIHVAATSATSVTVETRDNASDALEDAGTVFLICMGT